jgi:hypothetical protein
MLRKLRAVAGDAVGGEPGPVIGADLPPGERYSGTLNERGSRALVANVTSVRHVRELANASGKAATDVATCSSRPASAVVHGDSEAGFV